MEPSHWNYHAISWDNVGEPLRPCAQDIERLQQIISNLPLKNKTKINSLLLGVTPEIAGMEWPKNTQLISADLSLPMIKHVWTKNPDITSFAVCANWLDIPLPNKWADIVVGDGIFSFFNQYVQIFNSLKNIMKDDASLIIRFFVQPEEKEKPQAVFDDLRDGKIANFHIFKWRLAMSLHESSTKGVRVGDIWQAWQSYSESETELSARLNWPLKEINTINNYKDGDAIYYFQRLSEIRELFSKYFNEVGFYVENYQLAERCPLMVFQKKH